MVNEDIGVSVVMPAYNSEKTISLAIDSVLCQTHKKLELIVVNDCSKDGTEEITDEFGKTVTVQKSEISNDSFPAKPVWQRIIIIAAGAFMNFLLGFILMTVIVIGTEKYGSTKIAYFFA